VSLCMWSLSLLLYYHELKQQVADTAPLS
jgi:hypothetical protein